MSYGFGKFGRTAVCAAALMTLQQVASAATIDSALDVLGSYNLFVSGDVGSSTQAYISDSEGAMVVGGNAYLTSFANASTTQVNGYGLIVGGSLAFTNGSLGGNTYVGGSAALKSVSANALTAGGSLYLDTMAVNGTATAGGSVKSYQVSFGQNVNALGGAKFAYSEVAGNVSAGTAATNGGSIHLNQSVIDGTANVGSQGTFSMKSNTSEAVGGVITSNAALPTSSATAAPLNITSTWSNLTQESTTLGGLAQTAGATVVSQYGGLTLTGTNAKLDVFNITSTQLSGINDFTLNAPTGATVVINVTGSSVSWTNSGYNLNGVTENDVLFNFTNASSILFSGIGVEGSILATGATISGTGHLDGSIVASAIKGNIQLNSDPFTGSVSAVPLPGAMLLFGSSLLGLGVAGARRRAKRRSA